jgi:hypothetical protein
MHKKKALCAVQHRKKAMFKCQQFMAKNEAKLGRVLLQLRKEKSENAQCGEAR